MKKIVKLIILIVIAVAAVASVAVYAVTPIKVDVIALAPTAAAITFTEQGTYDYTRRIDIFPLLSGQVEELKVKEGDRITAGAVIAVVCATDYDYQIAQMESNIAGFNGQITNLRLQEQREREAHSVTLENLRSQLTVLNAEAAVNKDNKDSLQSQIKIQERIVTNNLDLITDAREVLRDARHEGIDEEINWKRQEYHQAMVAYDNSRIILEQLKAGEVPDSIFDSQREALEAQINVVRNQMNKSYSAGMQEYYAAQIEYAQAGIEQIRTMAGRAEIVAPAGGIVSRLPLKDTNIAQQGQPVAVLGERPEVEAFVPIREIDGVNVGDTVELILDSRLGERIINGTVVEIDSEAQAKTSALGVEERKVRVLIRPEGEGLQIGYDMDVRFTVYRAENAIVVPKTAVFKKDGSDAVWVIEDGMAGVRAVTKGVETRDGYIVTAGLSAGDMIVIDANNASLAEGKKAAAT